MSIRIQLDPVNLDPDFLKSKFGSRRLQLPWYREKINSFSCSVKPVSFSGGMELWKSDYLRLSLLTCLLEVSSPMVQVGPLRGTSAPGCHALVISGSVSIYRDIVYGTYTCRYWRGELSPRQPQRGATRPAARHHRTAPTRPLSLRPTGTIVEWSPGYLDIFLRVSQE